mgnify:CR=1 FL=1
MFLMFELWTLIFKYLEPYDLINVGQVQSCLARCA